MDNILVNMDNILVNMDYILVNMDNILVNTIQHTCLTRDEQILFYSKGLPVDEQSQQLRGAQ